MPSHVVRSCLGAALIVLSWSPAWAQDGAALERRGNAVLTRNCSRCHAIGAAGNSAHREAPAFRTLGQRYPIESLAETLAEGLSTGHPDMPEFIFETRDVAAILAYLQAIQEPAPPGLQTR
jgi:mono/diheme cytochrome c family protein